MMRAVYSQNSVFPKVSVESMPLVLLAMSLPFLDVAGLGGAAYVKPLALPVAFLIFAFRFATKRMSVIFPYDKSTKCALLFWGWALVGGLIMPRVVDAPLEMKGQYLGERIFRDLFALSLGLFFWILVRMELRNTETIVRMVRLMLASFWIVFIFCFVQILVIVFNSDMARSVDSFLAVFRSRQETEYGKIFGLAPEASMLADQLLTTYLPFVLASIVLNTSLFRQSRRGVYVERLIFFMAVVALVFSLSRIGFITLIVMLVCVYFLSPKLQDARQKRIPLAGILILGSVFTVGVFIAGDKFADFFNSFSGIDTSIEDGVWSNVTRAGSIATGVAMFLEHPFGVGTGAFPFLFERYVPNWALVSPEIQALIGESYDYLTIMTGSAGGDITERLPDAKALPVRVLAEMGFPGLMLLVGGWFYQARSCWQVALVTQVPTERVIAFGCVLSLLAMLPLSFSVNSYVWVHWLFVSAIATSLVCIQRRRQLVIKSASEPV